MAASSGRGTSRCKSSLEQEIEARLPSRGGRWYVSSRGRAVSALSPSCRRRGGVAGPQSAPSAALRILGRAAISFPSRTIGRLRFAVVPSLERLGVPRDCLVYLFTVPYRAD